MLTITVPAVEYFDEAANEFYDLPAVTLQLEHSLVSLSKWEAEWEKPFLGQSEKTTEEVVGYVKAMTLTENVPDGVYKRLTSENYQAINEYIGGKKTATWFAEDDRPRGPRRETVTSELIYYWVASREIPIVCETWHLSRLFTLIRVVDEKNAPQKKMNPKSLAERNRELNAARQAKYGTNG